MTSMNERSPIMRRLRSVLLAAACCAVLALAVGVSNLPLTSSALAGGKYSTLTIRGTYAWRCTGHACPAPAADLVPAVPQATVTSDAEGLFKGTGTVSLGGQIVQERIEGPAQVNPDGTGSIVYHVWIEPGDIQLPDWHINFL